MVGDELDDEWGLPGGSRTGRRSRSGSPGLEVARSAAARRSCAIRWLELIGARAPARSIAFAQIVAAATLALEISASAAIWRRRRRSGSSSARIMSAAGFV